MQQSVIKFEKGIETHKFEVTNNLDEYKLDIEAAFINWAGRVENEEDFNILDFCEYARSKNVGILICHPTHLK